MVAPDSFEWEIGAGEGRHLTFLLRVAGHESVIHPTTDEARYLAETLKDWADIIDESIS